jgi:hypothetical protein
MAAIMLIGISSISVTSAHASVPVNYATDLTTNNVLVNGHLLFKVTITNSKSSSDYVNRINLLVQDNEPIAVGPETCFHYQSADSWDTSGNNIEFFTCDLTLPITTPLKNPNLKLQFVLEGGVTFNSDTYKLIPQVNPIPSYTTDLVNNLKVDSSGWFRFQVILRKSPSNLNSTLKPFVADGQNQIGDVSCVHYSTNDQWAGDGISTLAKYDCTGTFDETVKFDKPILNLKVINLGSNNPDVVVGSYSLDPTALQRLVVSETNSPSLKLNGYLSMGYKFQVLGFPWTIDPRYMKLKVCIEASCTEVVADAQGVAFFSKKLINSEIASVKSKGVNVSYSYLPKNLNGTFQVTSDQVQVERPAIKPTQLRVSISSPISAHLGVPFPVRVTATGKGTALCTISPNYSLNNGASYKLSSWSTPSFAIKSGQTVTTSALMTVDWKGLWGVFLSCTDKGTGDYFDKFIKIVQN